MKKRRLKSEIYYADSIERVWNALTDPAQLAEWLAQADFKPVRGHRFKWVEPESPLDGAQGEVEEVEAPRRLTYRLEQDGGRMSVVSWTLESVGGGTRLIVEQDLLVASELRIHPSIVSLAMYRHQRSLLRVQPVVESLEAA